MNVKYTNNHNFAVTVHKRCIKEVFKRLYWLKISVPDKRILLVYVANIFLLIDLNMFWVLQTPVSVRRFF